MILLKKHEEITFLTGFILKILLNSSKSSALLWTFTNYQRFRNKSAERKKEKWKKTLAFCKKVWYYNLRKIAGCGAVGSALPWGGRGRGFKSRHSDHIKEQTLIQKQLSILEGCFCICPEKALFQGLFSLCLTFQHRQPAAKVLVYCFFPSWQRISKADEHPLFSGHAVNKEALKSVLRCRAILFA